MRFINPKNDFAFKKIFGSTESKTILKHFLNAVIYNGEATIQDLEIIDPYQHGHLETLKDTILDIKATITGDKIVVIEMQVISMNAFDKRVLYNAAKAISLQLETSQSYHRIKPVIAVTIADFILFPEDPELVSYFRLRKDDNYRVYPEGLMLVFVELPKFNKSLEGLETDLERWAYFLQEACTLEAIPESLEKSPHFQQAFAIAERLGMTPRELEHLQRREMFVQDEINRLTFAKEIGRKEQTIAIARSLLISNTVPLEVISQSTGLSLAELEAISQDLKSQELGKS
jgi:predicted transposase/invertase (TIGR01784 family)